MSLLALCPSRGRPQAAHELLASFEETRRSPTSRLVFVVDIDDPTKASYPQAAVHVVPGRGSMGSALLAASRDKRLLGDATTVGLVGDDCRFRTPGWDLVLDEALTASVGIAYTEDGHQDYYHANRGHGLPTHWWLSRPIVDRLGMAHPELRHFYMDDYWYELGTAAGCLRYFPELLIEHLHPIFDQAQVDGTYRRNTRHVSHDKLWFSRWKRNGIGTDLAVLRGILRAGQPRRVFADWHHPALWESLSILFEDRFGWELYSPLGPEWKNDVWRFTHQDWTEDDYLVHPSAKLIADHYELTPPEYPDRPRKLVTVEQANQMQWDYVVASVGVHQQTFGQLANRWGARLIHQVGDARRHIDARVRQVVLASSKAASAYRGAITYHQEFNRSLFRYSPPSAPFRVSAVMLRLDAASCDYQWMADAKDVLWSAVGGRDERSPTYLTPASKVAALMRSSGWIWHDKKIGDGYGHVLHNAAAMGRPLIGHGSHYKGQMGEQFWQDLKTCIDLDRHPQQEALRLFRAISSDAEWHTEMSETLAAVFEQTVNFDAEAEQIKAVLA